MILNQLKLLWEFKTRTAFQKTKLESLIILIAALLGVKKVKIQIHEIFRTLALQKLLKKLPPPLKLSNMVAVNMYELFKFGSSEKSP